MRKLKKRNVINDPTKSKVIQESTVMNTVSN